MKLARAVLDLESHGHNECGININNIHVTKIHHMLVSFYFHQSKPVGENYV